MVSFSVLENKQVRRSFFLVLPTQYNKSFIDQATIVVKSCRESCVHHFTSHLIPLFELLPVLFGKWHALVPPLQCWDCSWGSSWKIRHHILPGKSNIDKGEGVISKAMLPSQHFCPGLSENNCEQLLAYNTKFTADMQLVFSIITARWIIFIVVATGHYSQTIKYGISTYVLFAWRNIALQQYLTRRYNNRHWVSVFFFFPKFPFCFMKLTN